MPLVVDTASETHGRVASWREWERVGEGVDAAGKGARRFLPQGNPARGWGLNYGDRGIWIPRPVWWARGRAVCVALAAKAPTADLIADDRGRLRDAALDVRRERRAVQRDADARYASAWYHAVVLRAWTRERWGTWAAWWRILEGLRRDAGEET